MSYRIFLSIFFVLSFSAIAQELPTPVTVGEYADFLNAVAATDSHTLYHETMDGITRDGEPGDYHYEAVAGAENLEITFVTWLDAARYCNWKEHGSPLRDEVISETTETGSYTLNDDMSVRVVKNPGAHYFLPTSEGDSFIDPSLASNDRGFTIVEVQEGDCFNAVAFLGSSNPGVGDGTWSTFDEVLGVVGVLGVIGSGYACYRWRADRPHEQIPSDATVAGDTEANRRTAQEEALVDAAVEEQNERANPGNQLSDAVTETATDENLFAQDQRSGLKKWADWLRGHNHRNSIFQDADQIDYIQGEDLISLEHQTHCQKFIRWMTQPFYTYKDVEDFKNRNHQYKTLKAQSQFHLAAIAEKDEIIAEKDKIIAEQVAAHLEKDEIIAGHAAAHLEKDEIIAGHAAAHLEKDEIIAGHAAAHLEKDEIIAGQVAAHLEKDEIIAQHLITINSHPAVAEHQVTIGERDNKILELTANHEAVSRQQQEEHDKFIQQMQEKHAVEKDSEKKVLIAQHEAIIRSHKATQQEEKEAEDEARIARFAQFQKDQEKLGEATELILAISKLEPLCYSVPAVAAAQHAASSSSSATAVLEPLLTPFQMLREATQYLVIKKLQDIEKVAQGSQHAGEEDVVVAQIKNQYHELCKADAELMERLGILMSKKELLWKYLAEMENDFVDAQQVQVKIKSIEGKIPGIKTSIESYQKVVQERFGYAKSIFDGDQQSNLSREGKDRSVVGSSLSGGGSAEKKQKGLFQIFHLSSPAKGAQPQEAAALDLKIETACRELGKKIEKQFLETVNPITDRVEKLLTQSFEMLHLAEKNALFGLNLMRLCEADQGRKLWETSSLRPYLVDALTRARARVISATTLLTQEKTALGGTWQKQEDGNSRNTIYHYQGGGWQAFAEEADITQEIVKLQARTQKVDEGKLNSLAQKIAEARTIEGLLEAAKDKADKLVSAATTALEVKRAAFLAAMKTLLTDPILQPNQKAADQAQGGEEKADR